MFDGVLDFFVSLWDGLNNLFSGVADWLSSIVDSMNIDMNIAAFAILMWLACVIVLWKLMYDPKFISLPAKIFMTVVMLPICYGILHIMSNR